MLSAYRKRDAGRDEPGGSAAIWVLGGMTGRRVIDWLATRSS
jgi:hypothetical protein